MKIPFYSVRQNLPFNNTFSVKVFNEFNMLISSETRILKGRNKNKIINTFIYGYDNENRVMSIVIKDKKIRTLTFSKSEREKRGVREYTLENALSEAYAI